MPANEDVPTCGSVLDWDEGEYWGYCQLPEEHEGHHHDGTFCYDDEMDEVAGCIEQH